MDIPREMSNRESKIYAKLVIAWREREIAQAQENAALAALRRIKERRERSA